MKSHPKSPRTPEENRREFEALVAEADTITEASHAAPSTTALSQLHLRLESAQKRFTEIYAGTRAHIVARARSADATLRRHPYQSLAIAAGIGLFIGLLVSGRLRPTPNLSKTPRQ